VFYNDCKKKDYNIEQMKRELMEQTARLNTREEFIARSSDV